MLDGRLIIGRPPGRTVRGERGSRRRCLYYTWSPPPRGSRTWRAEAQRRPVAGSRWARRPLGPRPSRLRRRHGPGPAAAAREPAHQGPSARKAPGSAAPRSGAGGGTSLRGLRERMGERAGGLGVPARAGRGLPALRDHRAGELYSGVARAPSGPSPSPSSERPGTGRVAERGRGREGETSPSPLQPAVQLPLPTAAPLRRAGR